VVSRYPGDPVLVTEADEPNVEALTRMYGNGDEVQLPMDFQIADVNQLSAGRFRKLFNEIENNSAHGQPEYFFSNHDQPRQWDRYGDGAHNDHIAKLMAVLLLATRGTPQMYYGEELGMRTTEPIRVEDVHDPSAKSAGLRKRAATGSARRCNGTGRRRRDSPPRPSPGCRFRPAPRRSTWRPRARTRIRFQRLQAAAGAAQERCGAPRRLLRGA